MKPALITSIAAILLFGLVAAAAANQIQNGDFSAGNTGFGSDLVFTPTITVNGQYTIDDNPNDQFGVWSDMGDHTTGNGLMFMASPLGAPPAVRSWFQSVNVNAGTTYTFSGWVAHITNSTPARLQFHVDGSSIGGVNLTSGQRGIWLPFAFDWTAPATTSVELSVVDVETTGNGNDFALDDLDFSIVPVPAGIWLLGSAVSVLGLLRRRVAGQSETVVPPSTIST